MNHNEHLRALVRYGYGIEDCAKAGCEGQVNEAKEHAAPVEVLLPGFIVATANIQAGEPCLVGTRIPTYVGLEWVWESLDSPRSRRIGGLTREKIIALAAFQAGYEWHRRRKRRAAWEQAVSHWWDEYDQREYGDHHDR